jgi:hypothetical protein
MVSTKAQGLSNSLGNASRSIERISSLAMDGIGNLHDSFAMSMPCMIVFRSIILKLMSAVSSDVRSPKADGLSSVRMGVGHEALCLSTLEPSSSPSDLHWPAHHKAAHLQSQSSLGLTNKTI